MAGTMNSNSDASIPKVAGLVVSLLFVCSWAAEAQATQLIVPKKVAGSILDGVWNALGAPDDYTVSVADGALSFYIKTYRGVDMGTGAVQEQVQLYLRAIDNTVDVFGDVASPNDADTIRITFDVDNDHQATVLDRTILLLRKQTGVSCPACVKVGDATLGGLTNLSTTQWTIVNGASQWSVEIQINASDLGLNFIPSLMGMRVRERDTGMLIGIDHPSATSWDTLRSRNPIDFAVVLDNSGSMLSLDGLADSRWSRAKRAADLFAATLALFPDSKFDDRIGVSQYSWTCGNADPAADLTGIVVGLPDPATFGSIRAAPPSDPAESFTSLNTSNPPPNNCTPIQRGLEYAIRDQGAKPATDPSNLERDRIVLLLTDGLHNTPPGDVPFDLNDFTTTEKGLVQVRTVALGLDGIADTPLLDAIAGAFRGAAADGARYNNAAAFSQLLRSYVEAVEQPFAVNFIDANLVDDSYEPGPTDKLVFIGVWNDATQAQPLAISRDLTPQTTTDVFVSKKTGYAMAVFNAPQSGKWKITSPTGPAAPDQRYVLADLRVFAEFTVEQRQYEAGDQIRLVAKVTDRGSPVLGAEVAVEVDGPQTGLGTYLSTIQEDCSLSRPRVPSPRRGDSLRASPRTTSQLLQTPGATDPKPGRYQLASLHFARCGITALARDTLMGQRMFDDGSHGDLIPGDGIYTLAFSQTAREGSRNFVFHVRGRTADGIRFTRTRRLSRYVKIMPDADATEAIVQRGDTLAGWRTSQFYFLPRDRVGNYLGPGFAHLFMVRAVGARLLGSVRDLGNGYYEQVVEFPEHRPEPTVGLTMPGTGFRKTIDLSREQGPFALSLHAGIGVPHSAFKNAYDGGVGITFNLERRLSDRFRFAALFGFQRFDSVTTSAHLDVSHVSGSLEAFLTPGPLAVFVDAGGGMYRFRPGDTKPGAHAGLGVEFEPSLSLALGVSYRVHTVFTTGAKTTFSTIQAGGRVKF